MLVVGVLNAKTGVPGFGLYTAITVVGIAFCKILPAHGFGLQSYASQSVVTIALGSTVVCCYCFKFSEMARGVTVCPCCIFIARTGQDTPQLIVGHCVSMLAEFFEVLIVRAVCYKVIVASLADLKPVCI